jgi:hypothetical protein
MPSSLNEIRMTKTHNIIEDTIKCILESKLSIKERYKEVQDFRVSEQKASAAIVFITSKKKELNSLIRALFTQSGVEIKTDFVKRRLEKFQREILTKNWTANQLIEFSEDPYKFL